MNESVSETGALVQQAVDAYERSVIAQARHEDLLSGHKDNAWHLLQNARLRKRDALVQAVREDALEPYWARLRHLIDAHAHCEMQRDRLGDCDVLDDLRAVLRASAPTSEAE